MVAVFVKVVGKQEEPAWHGKHAHAGNFENVGDSIGYLQYLEGRGDVAYIQLGFVGWERKELA